METTEAGDSTGIGTVAHRLAELARELQREEGPQEVMQRIVEQAVRTVPGAEHGSISLVHDRRDVRSAAATSDVARGFDRSQQELGQGPCLDAMYVEETVLVDDLRAEDRWPALARRADDLGVRSLLCFQLFVDRGTLGGLNLMAAQPSALSADVREVGGLFAAHAAIALADAQKLEHLHRALTHRDVIGQAKGILMERFKVSADQAFALLARVSQDRNQKLHTVAEELVATGHLRR
ncbi:GAF and ANTAR domain-containing protein [Kineococcus sp. SYSU DK004]|uniref:GAF and ANTAR domain-containing protein n=1 Tax=Kineococcus sp. SYSU DK004 TaxID=3383125 RepID=UPI003D7E90FF